MFSIEGEGGLTPGVVHETMNSAWGLALDNLYLLVDWNDFGIDDHPVSDVVYGTPVDWIGSHGWRVFGTEQGSEWETVTRTMVEMITSENPDKCPSAAWFKTRKGREYLKYDNKSHGAPHARNSDLFWETKRGFVEKYGAEFKNFGGAAPSGAKELREEFAANLKAVMEVLRQDQALVDYLADALVSLGESVPDSLPGFQFKSNGNTPFEDARLFDTRNYPAALFASPGEKEANRGALAKWGAWVNSFGAKEYGRPLVMACSADLAGSTNISGFAAGFEDFPDMVGMAGALRKKALCCSRRLRSLRMRV